MGGGVSQHTIGQGDVYPSIQLGRGCIPACNWVGGVHLRLLRHPRPPIEMAIAVGGTHPTGMHSCCKLVNEKSV